MKIFFNSLLLIALLIFSLPLWASGDDSCSLAKEMWRQRLAYDITARREKVELNKTILGYKSKITDLEAKVADVEVEILAKPAEGNALWKKFDDLVDEMDRLYQEMEPYSVKHQQVSSNRRIKRVEFKRTEMEKRFECAMNKSLNEKLDKLAAGIGGDKRFSQAQREEIVKLINEKNLVIKGLTDDYKKYSDEIGKAYGGLINIEKETELLSKNEYDIDKRLNDGHETISLLFENIFQNIDSYSDKMNGISDNLLKLLENK